jgi:hypothetical protein
MAGTPKPGITGTGIIVAVQTKKRSTMKEEKKQTGAEPQEKGRSKRDERKQNLTDDGRESSNGKVRGVEGKDYVILSSGLGIDESEVTG